MPKIANYEKQRDREDWEGIFHTISTNHHGRSPNLDVNIW